MKKIVLLGLILVVLSCAQPPDPFVSRDAVFAKAAINGSLANEARQ